MHNANRKRNGAAQVNVTRVQAGGRMTVPAEIRRACRIMPGTDLLFVVEGPNEFRYRVVTRRTSLEEIVEKYTVEGSAPDMTQLRDPGPTR